MEDEHDVESHTLLRNKDLFVSIDDKVTTLIVATLSRILDNFLFAKLRKMAELRSNHDWNFANRHLVLLEDLLLRFDGLLACDWVSLAVLDLVDLNRAEDLRLVSETANPSRVRHDRLIGAVTFVKAWELIHSCPAK